MTWLKGLQRSIGANIIQLKQGGPKVLHEIPDGLRSPHSHVKRHCFRRIEHIYRETNFSNNKQKDVIELGVRLWNHHKAGPAKLDGNTFHRRASFPI